MTMTMDRPDVERAIETAGPEIGAGLIERLAQRLGMSASATAVYAPPVERDGLTVIPVARVRWAFGGGGGAGTGTEGQGSGAGGGGGVSAQPAGYIEIKDGKARYRPIPDPSPPLAVVPVILAGGFVASMLLRIVLRARTAR